MNGNPWDQRYDHEQYVYGTEANDFLREFSANLPAGRLLCIGDGEGRNSVYLAAQGHQVTAVDASRVGIEKAQRLAALNKVEVNYLVSDLADFEFVDNHWDTIVSIFCHLPESLRLQVHSRIVSSLKPGGLLLLEAYRPQQLEYKTGGPPVVEMMVTLAGLKQELAGLQWIHAEELDRNVTEGSLHTGKGAVVQLVARKPMM